MAIVPAGHPLPNLAAGSAVGAVATAAYLAKQGETIVPHLQEWRAALEAGREDCPTQPGWQALVTTGGVGLLTSIGAFFVGRRTARRDSEDRPSLIAERPRGYAGGIVVRGGGSAHRSRFEGHGAVHR